MFHINRKTKYALLALGYMSSKSEDTDTVTSAREISDEINIPYSLLAKIMQTLANEGFVKAVQGTKGGYILNKQPAEITVADAVNVFEGPLAITGCIQDGGTPCPRVNQCVVKDPLFELNQKIYQVMINTTLKDLVGQK